MLWFFGQNGKFEFFTLKEIWKQDAMLSLFSLSIVHLRVEGRFEIRSNGFKRQNVKTKLHWETHSSNQIGAIQFCQFLFLSDTIAFLPLFVGWITAPQAICAPSSAEAIAWRGSSHGMLLIGLAYKHFLKERHSLKADLPSCVSETHEQN